ncbi:MAG: AMP-binding protein, partial [Desulfobacterales bacterium]|nr:AMP-binding protein [Desulfobacterales bacterium]
MTITSEKRHLHRYGYAIADMTVSRLLADKARKNGDKVFCTSLHDGRTFTYLDIERQSNRLARGLMALGLGRGAHIAVMMDNSPEQMLLHFAIMKIGAVSVPLNTAARGKLLAYFLNQSDSVAVAVDTQYAQRVHEVLALAPAVRHVVTDLAALGQHADTPVETEVRFTDLAMLCYTSGTTGPSKGNMYAQATVVQFGMTTAESHGYRPGDVVYISLPINHSNAYFALWAALIVDASIALSRKFSVSRYWSEVRQSGATLTNLLGSMVNMLWSQPAHADEAAHRLRACVMVPVPPFAREWERRFAMRVVSSYGQTDYANVTVFTLVDPESKLGSAGRPRSGVELRVVDEDDLDVPDGEVGQVLVRSNNPWASSLGYYKMPEAT